MVLWPLVDPLAARAEFFDSGGVKTHYTVQGSGEPVMMVHGLYSSAVKNWELARNHSGVRQALQVIALDNRGHGQSDRPQAEGHYGAVPAGRSFAAFTNASDKPLNEISSGVIRVTFT